MTNALIGEAPPEPGGEFEVIGVERLGWFSADLVIAARRAFTRRRTAGQRSGYALLWCPLDSEIAIRKGETFRLLLPRRCAQPGMPLEFDAIAENPAFEARWPGGGEGVEMTWPTYRESRMRA
ncbi:MAG: hypothetical protein QOJ94_3203 [Sphingomonadales bacterium]|jgi:hypothetical protein|nr:hypothetical protein [Sphingomonadales bacterium]